MLKYYRTFQPHLSFLDLLCSRKILNRSFFSLALPHNHTEAEDLVKITVLNFN